MMTALELVGLALVFAGLWLIWTPLALIAAGIAIALYTMGDS